LGKPLLDFMPHQNAILDIAFSPDDMRLATASGDTTAKIIDMQTQKTISVLRGHTSSLKVIRFQPGRSSGNVIATGGRDGQVLIWDLRCKGEDISGDDGTTVLNNSLESLGDRMTLRRKATYGKCVNRIVGGHSPISTSLSEARDATITGMSFLPPGREHLLLTTSETNAVVKLWDIRMNYSSRQRRAVPLSSTLQPRSHAQYRQFGFTSLAINTSGSRIYGLSRDNTIYTYATSHLITGVAPELSISSSKSRPLASNKSGIGPLYGFRHPQLHASSFFIRLSVRQQTDSQTELLAAGSGTGCPLVFPTNEAYLNPENRYKVATSKSSRDTTGFKPPLYRTRSFDASILTRLQDAIPIYTHGVSLTNGHTKEATGLTWNHNGELLTMSDDMSVRVWRNDSSEASRLRQSEQRGPDIAGWGWAESDLIDDDCE
jgi:WD40 repeat protein